MLDSHRLQIERIKLQDKVNAALETRSDSSEFETRMNEATVLKRELAEKNEALIAALEKEDKEAQAAMANHPGDTSGWTPELRELREVGQKTSLADYVFATVEGRQVHGAAKEYNEHVFGNWNPGDYPLEMLLNRDEYFELEPEKWDAMQKDENRTVITGIAATHGTPTFVDRLLATSEAAFLMARFPAQGPGRHSYPVVSGTTVAATIARNTAETPAGGLTIVDADPERIQHSYEYAAADELQIPGVANGLAADLRMSLQAGLDNKVVDDLLTALDSPIVTDDPVTLAGLFTTWGKMVDGRGARTVNEVRMLVGTGTGTGLTAPAYGTIMGGSITGVTHAFVAIPHDRFRGSAHIPAAGGGTQAGIGVRTGGGVSRLIVPVWRRGTLLRDTGRLQLRGQITLTGVMYADVILVNKDQHEELTINVA